MIQQLINTQAKSNIMLTEISTQKHIRTTFPIKSLDEHRKVDDDIGENPDRYMAILKGIIGQQKYFCKRFSNIVSGDVKLKLNYDGVKNIIPFKDFQKLNNALFECLKTEGYDEKSYIADIRNAIKLFKGRHFKKQSILKKKIK
ncbi:uncharacterized protein [Eurosta solidaginis]|uniref:uncharacterized protein n=1 Tax=Eurosta solidaginis TaxID=178769 RepID=UPI003530BAEB